MSEIYSGELSEKEHNLLINEIYNGSENIEQVLYYVCPKDHLALISNRKQYIPQMIMCPNCEDLYNRRSEMKMFSKFKILTQ
jgi:uncharacterized protein YbaR (Trm112 family)